MSTSKIVLRPVELSDYKRLAFLESNAFGNDEFLEVAFGPARHREEDRVLEARGKEMAKPKNDPGEVEKFVKAVLIGSDGEEEIVGFAHWQTVLVSEGGVGVYAKEEENKVEKEKEDEKNEFANVANGKLCDDLFIPGDASMAKACEGRDYRKLFNLAVARDFQRQGVGTLLLKAGLKETDEAGLQCVLGASPEGLGLYKKYGFIEFDHMSLNLWEYEGGAGMGVVNHFIMHRPTRKQKEQ